jgi:hypothetical protein
LLSNLGDPEPQARQVAGDASGEPQIRGQVLSDGVGVLGKPGSGGVQVLELRIVGGLVGSSVVMVKGLPFAVVRPPRCSCTLAARSVE